MRRPGTMMKLLALLSLAVFGVLAQGYAQEKPRQEAAPKETAALKISRAILCSGVENLEPVKPGESFPSTTEKVYCFLEATSIGKDTEISVVWFHGDKELLKTTLSLKAGPRWRTYAHKNLRGAKGDWKAEVRDADGKPLTEIKFKVE